MAQYASAMACHAPPNPRDQLRHQTHPTHSHHHLIKVSSEPNVSLPQHPMHPIAVCQEAKPRLSKEQHDILEAHFQQQNKPSTSTKKGFAEALGVPLEKINNWFQNRRAKVKQELKKAQAQRDQLEQQMHQQMQQPEQPEQPEQPQQPQHQPQQIPMRLMMQMPPQSQPLDFYSNSPMTSSLPGNAFAVAPSPEMGMPQISTQDYGSPHSHHALQSISESTQPGSYDGIMASLASAGYDVQTTNGLSMSHGLPMDDPYMDSDPPALSNMPDDHLQFSDPYGPSHLLAGGFGAMPGGEFEFDALASPAPASFARKSLSTSASPCSGPQSLNNANSSATSLQSGWMDDGGATPSNHVHERSGSSDPTDAQWMQSFGQDVYHHNNTSNQTLMSNTPDFNQQLGFVDDSANHESPAGLLSQSMSNVDIQGPASDMGFKHDQSSTIAARRQRPRPAALGQASLRSASYSAGMPSSPGASNQHLKANMRVRKTRSTGLFGGGGRIQKPMTGPPQRSPLQYAFNEEVLSEYSHASINGPPMARSASLAPPTPLTPGVPSWSCPPGSAGMHSHEDLSQVDAPSSAFSMAPSTSVFSSASPPETPHSLISLMAARPTFKDTPPQSAPATQQSFPRNMFVPHPAMGDPHMHYHQSFRRPSMPEAGMIQSGFDFPMHPDVPIIHTSEMDLAQQSMHFAHDPSAMDKQMHLGPDMHYMPGPMPQDLFVHQYSPPDPSGFGGHVPPRRESQPKSYIFANQTPGDFKA